MTEKHGSRRPYPDGHSRGPITMLSLASSTLISCLCLLTWLTDQLPIQWGELYHAPHLCPAHGADNGYFIKPVLGISGLHVWLLGSHLTASNGKCSNAGLKELRFYLPQNMPCFCLMGKSTSVTLFLTDNHSAMTVENAYSSISLSKE